MTVDIDHLLADEQVVTVPPPGGPRFQLLKLFFGAYGETYRDKGGFRAGIARSIEKAGVIPEKLHYKTSDGDQIAWYIPPQRGGRPSFVWLAFNGVGQLALAWIDVLADGHFPSTAFILVDYPGYGGWCRGEPSRDSIARNAGAAALKAQSRLGMTSEEFQRCSGILGYSVGCAAGLLYAADHPVEKGVLIAPFVGMWQADVLGSLPEPISRFMVSQLGIDFDNAENLDRSRHINPSIRYQIYHGKQDSTCRWMGSRHLALERFPEFVTLLTDNDVGHDIYDKRRREIRALLGIAEDSASDGDH